MLKLNILHQHDRDKWQQPGKGASKAQTLIWHNLMYG